MLGIAEYGYSVTSDDVSALTEQNPEGKCVAICENSMQQICLTCAISSPIQCTLSVGGVL